MSVLEELRGRRNDVWGKIEGLLDESASEGMSHEQADRHGQLEAEYARLDTDIKARERAEATKADLDTPRPVPGGVGPRGPIAEQVVQEERAYAKAFEQYLRGGDRGLSGTDRELLQKRAQSIGVSTGGGYLVPEGFRMKLVERMKAFGGLAANVENFTTETGQPLEWPTLDDTGNSGAIVAENTQATTGADVTFGSETLGAYKYEATGASGEPITLSVELLQDSAFDLESIVARIAARRIARKQAADWVNGTGVGQPKGLVYGKTGIECAANTGVTYADLVHYVHSVDPDYRMGAKWAFNDASLEYIRSIVDDNGRPLWLPQQESGMGTLPGGSLLGFPVVVDQAFASMSLSSNTVNWGAFGDFVEGYVIRNVRDVQLIVDPYSQAKKGQVQFNFWARADGVPQDTFAYVALTGQA